MKKSTSAEFEAEELIKNFDIKMPINPIDICALLSSNSLKIEYHEEKIEEKNIDGMSIAENGSVHIVVNSNIKLPARRLFTAAHELGHVILHIQTGKKTKSECSSNDISNHYTHQNIETEANQFASALLMPRHLIAKKINSHDLTWVLIKEISRNHNTSLEATARRVINVSKDMCALIIHEHDSILTPFKSRNFPCFLPKSNFPRYLRVTNYSENEMPDKPEECDLSDWNLKLSNKIYRCYYSTLNFKAHFRKMTLLVLEEKEDDEQEWKEPEF